MTEKEQTPEQTPVDYKKAMMYHSDRADKYMDERDKANARIAQLESALKSMMGYFERQYAVPTNYPCYQKAKAALSPDAVNE
jgi:hypothetical protein